MSPDPHREAMTARLIDQLYVEAMLLADEARGYFDGCDQAERAGLAPVVRVTLACESLRVTTRLMHVIAWLLDRRAEAAGEVAPRRRTPDGGRLGQAGSSEPAALADLPLAARQLIATSMELHARVARLDRDSRDDAPASPVRALIGRLEGARF